MIQSSLAHFEFVNELIGLIYKTDQYKQQQRDKFRRFSSEGFIQNQTFTQDNEGLDKIIRKLKKG